MKKKTILSVIIVFILIFLGVLLWRSGGERDGFSDDESIGNMPSGNENAVKSLVNNDPLLKPDQVSAEYEEGEITEEDITNVLDEVGFTKEQFMGAYEKALEAHDGYLKLNIAETVYKTYKNPQLLPIIIVLAMQQHNIKKASEYLKIADITNRNFIDTVGVHTIISLLLNQPEEQLDPERVKSFVNSVYEADIIDDFDKYYYYSLVALSKGDINNFQYYSDQLAQSDEYEYRHSRLQAIRKEANNYEFAPDYFYNGLLGVELFYEGWYRLAEQQGEYLVETDPGYQLGYQLQGYAAIFMSEWAKAARMFEYIKQQDASEVYLLLQAISLFHNEIYTESVLLLKQIGAGIYALDAKRYLLLSYNALQEVEGVENTIQSMIGYDLSPYDYFTIFDILFFGYQSRIGPESDQEIYQEVDDEVVQMVLDQCRQDLEEQYGFVCFYGKAGLLYRNKDYDKALPLMQGLVQWYPTSRIYERIGHIAWIKNDYETARKAFIKAFASSSDSTELQYLRQRVTEVLNKGSALQ